MSLDNKKHLMVCYMKFLWVKKDFSVIEACKMTIRASLTLTLAFVCGCGNDAVESEIKALRKEVALLQGEIRELRKSIGHRPAFDREAHRERLEVMRRSTESRTNGIYRVHPPAMPSSPEEATDGQKVKEGAMRKMEMRRMAQEKIYSFHHLFTFLYASMSLFATKSFVKCFSSILLLPSVRP